MNPNSLKNLKPAKKGEVRNPKGRNKGSSIKDLLDRFGNLPVPEEMENKFRKFFPRLNAAKRLTMKEGIYLNAVINALKGDSDARNFHAERTEGKVTQPIEDKSEIKKIIIVRDQQTKDDLDTLKVL